MANKNWASTEAHNTTALLGCGFGRGGVGQNTWLAFLDSVGKIQIDKVCDMLDGPFTGNDNGRVKRAVL
jgi:hypothetical protein